MIWALEISTIWVNKKNYPSIANNYHNRKRSAIFAFSERYINMYRGFMYDGLDNAYRLNKNDIWTSYYYNEVAQEVFLQWLEEQNIDTANLINVPRIPNDDNVLFNLVTLLEVVSDYSQFRNSDYRMFAKKFAENLIRYDFQGQLKEQGFHRPQYELTSLITHKAFRTLQKNNHVSYNTLFDLYQKRLFAQWNQRFIQIIDGWNNQKKDILSAQKEFVEVFERWLDEHIIFMMQIAIQNNFIWWIEFKKN